MDASDISQLFAYMAASRRRFLAKFRDLGWEEVTRNREATHHSMRNILLHMLDVEDSYLQEAIQGRPVEELDPAQFETIERMEAHDREVARRTEEFFEKLAPEDLGREVYVEWWKEGYSMEHVLLHTFLDEMAHIGELICLMWQIDIEPPFRSIVRSWTNARLAPSE